MDREMQPNWPSEGWPSKAEAVAAAFDEMRDEEGPRSVLVHQATCSVRWDLECDCAVEVIPQMGGKA